MPMVFPNPFVLAAVTVVAIGVITYQILKRRIPVGGGSGGPYGPGGGGPHGPGGGGPHGPGGGGPYRPGSGGPNESTKTSGWVVKTSDNNEKVGDCDPPKSEKSNEDSSVIRRRSRATASASDNMSDTGSGGPSGPDSGRPSGPGSGRPSGPGSGSSGPSGPHSGRPSGPDSGRPSGPGSGRPSRPDSGSGRTDESEKTHEDTSVIRGQNVATTSASDNMSDNHPYSPNSFDENSDLKSDSSNEKSDTSKKINKTQETMSKKTFVANINDEDSDSSESNASNQNDNISIFSNESNCSKASSSTTEYKKRKNSSSVDSSEELYKRKVCSYLKNNINKDDPKEKTTDELLESDLSVDLDEPSTSSASMKPVMCKGCLEELANAVAYPCQHCYLCLDCAFKVHRIYKKCSICQSVVKTFEQLKM